MNTDTVVIGLVMVVIGVLLGWFLCLGAILVAGGLIVIVIGVVQEEPQKHVRQYYVPAVPPPAQQQAYVPPYQSQGVPIMFCPFCGTRMQAGTTNCTQCNRRVLQ